MCVLCIFCVYQLKTIKCNVYSNNLCVFELFDILWHSVERENEEEGDSGNNVEIIAKTTWQYVLVGVTVFHTIYMKKSIDKG